MMSGDRGCQQRTHVWVNIRCHPGLLALHWTYQCRRRQRLKKNNIVIQSRSSQLGMFHCLFGVLKIMQSGTCFFEVFVT